MIIQVLFSKDVTNGEVRLYLELTQQIQFFSFSLTLKPNLLLLSLQPIKSQSTFRTMSTFYIYNFLLQACSRFHHTFHIVLNLNIKGIPQFSIVNRFLSKQNSFHFNCRSNMMLNYYIQDILLCCIIGIFLLTKSSLKIHHKLSTRKGSNIEDRRVLRIGRISHFLQESNSQFSYRNRIFYSRDNNFFLHYVFDSSDDSSNLNSLQ